MLVFTVHIRTFVTHVEKKKRVLFTLTLSGSAKANKSEWNKKQFFFQFTIEFVRFWFAVQRQSNRRQRISTIKSLLKLFQLQFISISFVFCRLFLSLFCLMAVHCTMSVFVFSVFICGCALDFYRSLSSFFLFSLKCK